MSNLKQNDLQIETRGISVSPALQKKLNRKLEEAAVAFDKTYDDDYADQNRILKLRQRARTLSQQVVHKQPRNLDALNMLGRIALDEGNLSLAKTFLDQGLDAHPASASLLYSRAHLHLAYQEYDLAEKLFTQADKIAPKDTRSIPSIAYTKIKQGLFVEAFDLYSELIKQDPTDPHIRSKLFECIRHIQADFYSPQLESELLTYLDFTQVNHDDLSSLIASILTHKYDLIKGNTPLDPQLLSKDKLLNKALRLCQFHDPIIEEFLTACRQCILQESIEKQHIEPGFMNFLVSISLQCINNEFVYSVSLTEEKVLRELQTIVIKTVNQQNWKNSDIEYPILLLSMYCMLHDYGFRGHLLRKPMSSWSKSVQFIIEPHLYGPQKETEIQRTIEALSSIKNPISFEVGKQYEESPYPRWTALDYATKTDYGQALSAELQGFTPPSFLHNQTIKVLVAGCGTGQHAIKIAKYFRNVEVIAIDLSRASLAYGKSQARKFKLSNIEFFQADILDLSALKEKFHVIECSGVLHHMENPIQGWRALTHLLEPGGLMKIALYSERARQIVTTARALIRENQLSASNEHIRIFRQAILDNQLGGDFSQIKQSFDFYNLSGCRDLLFNVQEHQFTPLDIADSLATLKLEFLGFVNLQADVKTTYDTQFLADRTRTNLENWHQFEATYTETFNGMYQFYCQFQTGNITHFPD